MNKEDFKIGAVVKHKTTEDFKMVILDHAVYYGDQSLSLDELVKFNNNVKNTDTALCKYYNIYTKEWETKSFYLDELELWSSKS